MSEASKVLDQERGAQAPSANGHQGFTPGPWHARPSEDGEEWDVVFEDGEYRGVDAWNIAEVYPYVVGEQSAEANARLIAAAPDLLAALDEAALTGLIESAIGAITMANDNTPTTLSRQLRDWLKGARAAIARAEGR